MPDLAVPGAYGLTIIVRLMEPGRRSYRTHLKTAVAASGAPYGYTLTIWTSGAVTTHALGIPTAWEALLLLAGAVLGFGVTAAVAYGRPGKILASREPGSVRLWGGFISSRLVCRSRAQRS